MGLLMPIVRIFLVLLALVSPALAQDGARNTAAAQEATQAFRLYIDGVTKKGERPDPTQPEVAALLARVFDLDAFNALPPVQGSDVEWLIDWVLTANTTNKLLMFYGMKPGPRPDLAALQVNMAAYEDQYATIMNFLIRAQARQAAAAKLFMAGLTREQRTPVRERGLMKARQAAAEFVLSSICAVIESGAKPANVRLVAAAIRDTRDVWAGFFLPEDRARVLEYLANLPERVKDETARNDVAAFTAALEAVN